MKHDEFHYSVIYCIKYFWIFSVWHNYNDYETYLRWDGVINEQKIYYSEIEAEHLADKIIGTKQYAKLTPYIIIGLVILILTIIKYL